MSENITPSHHLFFYINYAATLEVTVLNVQVLYIPKINTEVNYSHTRRRASYTRFLLRPLKKKKVYSIFFFFCDLKREEDCSTCDPGLWFLSLLCLGGRRTQRAGAFFIDFSPFIFHLVTSETRLEKTFLSELFLLLFFFSSF